MNDQTTDVIETYAARGWATFPLAGKTPRLKWRDLSSTDAKRLAAMFDHEANGQNIGLDCGKSGLVVIDLDVKNGVDGLATWRELGIDDTGALVSQTGGGGTHLIFRDTSGGAIGNSTGKLGPGVDVRGNGGYIVLPPSMHPDSGKPYLTLGDWDRAPGDIPALLADLLTESEPTRPPRPAPRPGGNGKPDRYADAALANELAALARAQDGSRNHQLNTAAFNLGQFVAAGRLDQVHVERALYAAAVGIGLGEHEARATIESGMDSGAGHPRWPDAQPGNGRDAERVAAPASTTEGERRKTPMSAEFIKTLTDMGYTFRLNATTDDVEVNGEPISDVVRAEIRVRMRDADYRRHLAAIEDAYVTAAAANAYHPVRDYLAGLTYDGLGHIDALAAHFEDTHGVFATYLKRWLVGAVARTMATATTGAQNAMLAIDGGQGIGKSYFVRWLCSPVPGMFVDAPIVPGDKDCDILLMSAWIWEVSELGATTRKADRESLKAFISKELVTVRKPYGHYPVRKPALASFIGTVNNESGILSDPTGNRRFNVCTVTAIDWAYTKAVNLDALWAEALALYRAKEPWQLTRDEMRRAAEVNEEFMAEDPIEGLLRKHFGLDGADGDWLPTTNILGALQNCGLTGSTRGNAMALSATMKRLGLKRYRLNKVWGYYGVKVKL